MNRYLAMTTVSLLVLIAGRAVWLPWIGGLLIYEDVPRHVDAIVPLAGERLRIPYAAELFNQGYADWLVVTNMAVDHREVGSSFRYADSARQDALNAGVPAERIVEAPTEVATTYAEAKALHELVQHHGWTSLMVVTSPYHTRRSHGIFEEVFRNSGVVILVQSVHPHWYNPEDWWIWPGGRQTTALEYLKLALYYLGYHCWKE